MKNKGNKKLFQIIQLRYCGASFNSELKGENYGKYSNTWIYIWTYGCVLGNVGTFYWNSLCKKNGKPYKTSERKGNPRRGLQGRVIHGFVPVSHRGVG